MIRAVVAGMTAAIALTAATGCGALLGLADPVEPEADASSRFDGGADAPSSDAMETTPDAACDPAKPFGKPVLVPGSHLNTAADEGTPRLSPNELTLYFWSNRAEAGTGAYHLYAATRSTVGDAFGEPSLLASLASSGEASPTVTADGKTLIFESDRLGGGHWQLFQATRENAIGDFGPPTLLANVNAAADDATPYLRPDGQVLYFASARGDGASDLYRALRMGDGTFAAPTALAELDTPSDEVAPCVSPSDLEVLWGSKRTDLTHYGDFDIYVAERLNASDGFASVANAGDALNSSALDLPGWISPDGCSLYLESTRTGNRDLFVARRPP